MLKIAIHGGHCCGIKHIYGFNGYPSGLLPRKKATPRRTNVDVNNGAHTHFYNFYHPSRPRETYEERFRAYVAWLREFRPGGIVEVTLTDYFAKGEVKWEEVLFSEGFKMVNQFVNSNTCNKVNVYHLVMEEDINDDDDDDDDYDMEY